MAQEMSQSNTRKQALAALAKLGGQLTTEDDVIFEGTKFILPGTVKNLKDGIKVLMQRMEDEEQTFSFNRTFKYRPWDGAAAADRAIRRAFGFSMGVTLQSFFGDRPPQTVTIATGVHTTIEVPWGQVELPGLEGATVYFGQARDNELGLVFQVNVEAKRKFRKHIQGLMSLIEEELNERSIYKGHAIDGATMPNFIDTTAVDPEDVVYTEEVMRQLGANVWSPIRHAEQLERLGQPGKRSVLFEGPYGTGKTLAAYLTAKVAQENGWTFLMCRPGRDDLFETLQTARMYQPAVVFFEDLDVVGAPGEVDNVSKILDNFDGMATKGLKMLLVLTTNHVENIHKGMIRPGRLDAVIHIGAMDRPGVEKLARRTIKTLDDDVDFDLVFKAYDGFMPAFVKEAIDRAVRYSVNRNDGVLGSIGTEDLVLAANGLRTQLDIMNAASDTTHRPSIESSIQGVVKSTLEGAAIKDADDDFWGSLELKSPTAV